MTTINTIHDLSRILREHPEWREEFRRTLLTEELLALPQRLTEYAQATDRRLDALTESVASLVEHAKVVDRRLESVDRRLESVDRRLESVDRRLESVDRRLESVDRRLESVDRRLESVDRRLDALTESVSALAEHAKVADRRLESLEEGMAVNNRHIGEMKGRFMERDVSDNAALIASDMGLVWQKSLDRQEVVALVDEAVRNGKAAGIPTNHLRVLRRADLIMEAADEQSQTAYIVAEISWTAAERDTERAIRNAGYVALFTGRTTYAAVASVHIDKEVADMLTQDAPQPHGSATYEKAFHASVDEQPPLG